ncbi:MAG: cyclodeaminase/cyclohydrolase family protein [Bacillota bacterium]
MLKDLPLEVFVREVASNSPAPGGGSVAALAGAQAAGLLSMYCNLSQNREKLGDVVDQLQENGEEARFLMTKLLEALDEDTIAFNRVMEAYRMPKGSEEEKNKRKEAIQEAMINAADVPMHTARGSLRVSSLVNEVAGRGNPMAVTDLGVANLQALSGVTGACYNVRINLESIKDQEKVEEFAQEVSEILKEGQQLFEENKKKIEKDI